MFSKELILPLLVLKYIFFDNGIINHCCSVVVSTGSMHNCERKNLIQNISLRLQQHIVIIINVGAAHYMKFSGCDFQDASQCEMCDE